MCVCVCVMGLEDTLLSNVALLGVSICYVCTGQTMTGHGESVQMVNNEQTQIHLAECYALREKKGGA